MSKKPNQYRIALIAVESAFQRHDEAVTGGGPSSKGAHLGSKVGGSSWKSPKAEEYAEKVRGIVTRITDGWESSYESTRAKTSQERDKLVVDEESEEGWKATSLEMKIR